MPRSLQERCLRTSLAVERLGHELGRRAAERVLATSDPGFKTVEDRSQLAALLARLPSEEREMIELRFVEELTQSEIATRLNSTQVRVSRQLARSLAKLRAWAWAENV